MAQTFGASLGTITVMSQYNPRRRVVTNVFCTVRVDITLMMTSISHAEPDGPYIMKREANENSITLADWSAHFEE